MIVKVMMVRTATGNGDTAHKMMITVMPQYRDVNVLMPSRYIYRWRLHKHVDHRPSSSNTTVIRYHYLVDCMLLQFIYILYCKNKHYDIINHNCRYIIIYNIINM